MAVDHLDHLYVMKVESVGLLDIHLGMATSQHVAPFVRRWTNQWTSECLSLHHLPGRGLLQHIPHVGAPWFGYFQCKEPIQSVLRHPETKNNKEEYLSAKYQLIYLKLSFCSPKMWKLIHLWQTTKIANEIDRSCRVGSIPGKITTCLPLPSTRVRPLALSARDFRRFFCFIFGRWLAVRDLVRVWCVFVMLQSLPSGSLT